MSNPDIYVIHRKDTKNGNIGDLMSAPSQYVKQFPWLKDATAIDIETDIELYAPRLKSAVVVLGGGGLIETTFFEQQLKLLLELRPSKLIAWGVGHNAHGKSVIEEPNYLKSFDLVGLRDYGQPDYFWVPCPSACSPYFDSSPPPTHKIVIYSHWKRPIHNIGNRHPELTNASTNMEETIGFLASGETIITNSYHGAYWATLLGRRVVIVKPFSSKFYGLRYEAPVVEDDEWHFALKHTKCYTNALKECRSANVYFGESVRDLIGT